MAIQAGNKKILYWGKQVAKGTAQTTPTLAMRVTDFQQKEVRTKIQLAETDASTQDGASVVAAIVGGFTFKAYVRPSEMALLAEAVQGSNTDSGSSPNYTHTATPTETQAYYTVYEREPSLLCNQHVDAKLTRLVVRGGAGGPLEVEGDVETIQFAAGATAPTTPAPASELPLIYPEVTCTKAGSAPGTIDAFEITIERNTNRLTGDSGYKSFDLWAGKYMVTAQLTNWMQSDANQRAVDTGSTSGTAPTSTIATETLDILVARNSNLSVRFTLPASELLTISRPVRTDGSPLQEELGYHVPPQSTFANALSVITKNALATP